MAIGLNHYRKQGDIEVHPLGGIALLAEPGDTPIIFSNGELLFINEDAVGEPLLIGNDNAPLLFGNDDERLLVTVDG